MAIGRRLGAWVLVALAFPALAQTEADSEFGDTETEDEAIAVETAYGLFSNGYLRIGVGSTDGGDFTIFRLNGAGSKYRLGNESDVYAEFGLGYRAPLANGSDFVVEAMVNGYGDSNAFTDGDAFAGDSNLVQAYAGIENIGTGAFREAFVWLGGATIAGGTSTSPISTTRTCLGTPSALRTCAWDRSASRPPRSTTMPTT